MGAPRTLTAAEATRSARHSPGRALALLVRLRTATWGFVFRSWMRIREPRVLRALFWCGYLIATLGGISTFARPAIAIEEAWGPILGFSWSTFWLIGGLVGMTTCLTGWWQVERAAVGLIQFGLAIYAVVIIYMAITRGNSLSGLITIAFAALLFTIRLTWIRGHDFEPRRR